MAASSDDHDSDLVAQAEALQRALAVLVEIPAQRVPDPRTVTGVDVSYPPGAGLVAAAAVTVELPGGAVLDEAIVRRTVSFRYRPGLLALRELPALLEVLGRLRHLPDLVMCDGQGVAHPRRCGLACHLGVEAGVAALGCAKSPFFGEHVEPGLLRGDRAPLRDGADLIGHVLRTQDGIRPVYVSPGHRIGFDQACDIVLATTTRFRLPDPLRLADQTSRAALRT